MTNSEQAIREFVEKWGWFVKATSIDMTQFELNKDTEQCLSDLTALISEGYYPKEFVMWLSYNSSHYVIKTQNRWWSNSQDKYMTLDELYDYWKENEQ